MALPPLVVVVHAITGAVLRDEYPLPPGPMWEPGEFKVQAFDRIAVHH